MNRSLVETCIVDKLLLWKNNKGRLEINVCEVQNQFVTEITIFTARLCLSTGGYPSHQVLSLVSGPGSFPGEGCTPDRIAVSSGCDCGTPMGLGYPPGWDWCTPSPSWDWGTPSHLLGDRTPERVLVTWRAVCLLRSRRRTFLSGINLI